ncbi:MAG: carboxypeptidase-like regulatory domain-containing protein [Acidobacteria bacterium]|nr:carboxypeptidase-like regulatory domain-containing protein [Acidobacteriota bacterium]
MSQPRARFHGKLYLCLPLLVACAVPTAARAQDFRGAITGRVSDNSGGRLPGATVTATNKATNGESHATTNAEGDYTILYLTPGFYTVGVELPGFKKHVRDGIEVARSWTRSGSRCCLCRTATRSCCHASCRVSRTPAS